jgi:hypothetical protein
VVRCRLSACLLAAFALASIGCGTAESTISTSVRQDSWETLTPTKVQARAGKLDGGKLELAIDNQVVASGPMKVGTVIPIAIEGHPCEVKEASWFETNDTLVRDPKHRKQGPQDFRNVTFKGVNLEITCKDGPVPGTAASRRGANPKTAFPPTMAGLFAGFGLGALFEKDRIGLGLLVLLAGLAIAVVLGLTLYQGLFAITLPAIFLGYGVIGTIVGTSTVRMSKPSIAFAVGTASIVGAIPVLFVFKAWGELAPLLAFGGGVLAAVIAAVIWALAQPD